MMETDFELMERAQECYGGLQEFRDERERCKRFTYGDQWSDLTDNGFGAMVTERQFIENQGNVPLRNNLIRRLVRNVLGVYRNRWRRPVCSTGRGEFDREVNVLLERNMTENRMEEVYARTMEEYLIGGLVVHKKWYGRRRGECMCRTDMVSPTQFFYDLSARDFRGDDISIIGEVHDVNFEDVSRWFARSREERRWLQGLYGASGGRMLSDKDCRVYEVWDRCPVTIMEVQDERTGRLRRIRGWDALETEERLRASPLRYRVLADEEWRYSFLAPTGHVLARGLTPYSHGSHPYIMKTYPFVDGEIHSFVNDVIDQQKLTNRLISMYDWMLRASAKGMLLLPEGSVPDGVDVNDIVEEWGRFNGVIVYKSRAGVPPPQQVSSKSVDIGITDLLEIQMKMMEDITGVNGALQGKLESNSMSGTLYDQQTRNSLTSLIDLMKGFDDFMMEATRMDVSNLLQYERGRRREDIRIYRGTVPTNQEENVLNS